MNKLQRAIAVERGLFLMLLIALGIGGFFYERYKSEMQGWLLPAMIISGFCLCYSAYRVALRLALNYLAR